MRQFCYILNRICGALKYVPPAHFAGVPVVETGQLQKQLVVNCNVSSSGILNRVALECLTARLVA